MWGGLSFGCGGLENCKKNGKIFQRVVGVSFRGLEKYNNKKINKKPNFFITKNIFPVLNFMRMMKNTEKKKTSLRCKETENSRSKKTATKRYKKKNNTRKVKEEVKLK